MKNNASKVEILFQLTHNADSSEFGTFDLHLVQHSDSPDRGGMFQVAQQPGAGYGDNAYNDLAVHGQWNRDASRDNQVYGFDVMYRQPYALNLRDMEPRIKLLRKIDRRLNKFNDELGYTQAWVDYVRRVALILGVKRAVVYERTGEGWTQPFSLDVLMGRMLAIVNNSLFGVTAEA